MAGIFPRFIVFSGLLLIAGIASGKDYFIIFSDRTIQAQELIYQLRLNEAEELLKLEESQNPQNTVPSYLRVISRMMSYLATESEADFDRFDEARTQAIDCIEEAPASLGYRLFLLEEVYFYSAVVDGKHGNTIAAAKSVMQCHKYGSRAVEKYPDLKAAKKTLGLITSGFGSLPTNYQKLVSFFGYETSMDKGIAMLKDFIEAPSQKDFNTQLKREANFYLASIYLYLKNDKTKAWNMITDETADYRTNPLSAFARVNFADKCKKNDVIISTIRAIPTSGSYTSLPFLDFMMGKAKLQRLDDDADVYLKKFLTQTKGKSYVKSCYQKLAWHALIRGEIKEYNQYLSDIKSHGDTQLEEDGQAEKFAESSGSYHVGLLKARLLFDGGYYQRALDVIQPLQAKDFDRAIAQTEYFYRKGRIYHEMGTNNLAKAFYKDAIRVGRQLTVYYASYSALYMAELYESERDYSNAKKYFQMATSFSENEEYKRSIEHRSKSGLKRIQ